MHEKSVLHLAIRFLRSEIIVVRCFKNIGLKHAIKLVFNLFRLKLSLLSDSMKPENEPAPPPSKRQSKEEEPICEPIPKGNQSIEQKGQ